MEILKKSRTPDGTDIRIEDWSMDYSCMPLPVIAAYPKTRWEVGGAFVRKGDKIRATLSHFESEDECNEMFDALSSGEKTITGIVDLFDPYGSRCFRIKDFL